MSYKQCFFAVPTSTSFDTLLKIFGELATELRDENGYSNLYLAANPPQHAEASGLWLLHLTATPAPSGRVPRDFFTDWWPEWHKDPLYIAVYDDQHGVFQWQERKPGGGFILSQGHRVVIRNMELTVDYPQRAFTRKQLDQALHKPEEALSEAERRALMEYDDAVTLGLRQLGTSATRGDLIDLLYVEEVWPLLGADRAKAVPRPKNAGAVASPYIDRYTFEYCDLTPSY